MALNSYSQTDDATCIEQMQTSFSEQKRAFNANPFPSLEERSQKLLRLKQLLLNQQEQIIEALDNDFSGRSHHETLICEVTTSIQAINYYLKKLPSWIKPQKRKVSIHFQPAKSSVQYQPKGVVGIIVPWNYPVYLSLGPLISALAAGNHVMIKMSEYTPATNELLTSLLAQIYSCDQVSVFSGGAEVAANFSTLAFDHLFYTGSTAVGRLVMSAAAKNLTPVTLELGGKTPTIIADDVEIKKAVGRFLYAKSLNSGQTCVAPDYVFCPANKVTELVDEIKKDFHKMYPNFWNNKDYTSLIHQQQYQRIIALREDAEQKGATIIDLVEPHHRESESKSEKALVQNNKMPLALVLNANESMDIMQEEIFGPLLPILPYENIDEALSYIAQKPRPLALYVMTYDLALQEKVQQQSHSGGLCFNDAAMHLAQEDLPFGGVGASGMGQYHGKEGFETFSHLKAVYQKSKLTFSSVVFPPYGNKVQQFIMSMLQK